MDIQQLTKLQIKGETYDVVGNKVTCKLVCKMNLKEFERQSFMFTETFIRDTIGRHLPIVKVIRKETDDIYNGITDVAAKYYITGGNQVRIIYFDNEYFNETRKPCEPYHYAAGDIVPYNSLPNAASGFRETNEFHYIETFEVRGTAVCAPEDKFDVETGKTIAFSKAMVKANDIIGTVYFDIVRRLRNSLDTVSDAVIKLNGTNSNILKAMCRLTW